MCVLYSQTRGQQAIIEFARAMRYTRNLEPMPQLYADRMGPVAINRPGGKRELAMARWGLPSSQKAQLDAATKRADKLRARGKTVDFNEMLRLEPDSGTPNVRNVKSRHWARWLGLEHRCVVPFTSFSEYSKAHGGDVWFALDDSRPLAFFAGIFVPQWTSVRKIKEGETTNDLYGFLTTEPNAEVAPVHAKAMPVILRTQAEVDRWMTAEWKDAAQMQQPLPDGTLKIVAAGKKYDQPAEAGVA